MIRNENGFPIFEDNDDADLNEYSEEMASVINQFQNNLQKAIGLGGEYLTRLSSKNINSINLNGFAYLMDCNYGGTTITNGYLLQLIYSDTYKIQFYIMATGTTGLQYRKLINGTWQSWANV